jgi:hypothetical protein
MLGGLMTTFRKILSILQALAVILGVGVAVYELYIADRRDSAIIGQAELISQIQQVNVSLAFYEKFTNREYIDALEKFENIGQMVSADEFDLNNETVKKLENDFERLDILRGLPEALHACDEKKIL